MHGMHSCQFRPVRSRKYLAMLAWQYLARRRTELLHISWAVTERTSAGASMESKVRKDRVWHIFVWDRWTNGNMAVMSNRRWCVWSLPWLAAALSPCSQAHDGVLSRSCPCASYETNLFAISGPAKDWQQAGLTCQDLSDYILFGCCECWRHICGSETLNQNT